MGRLIDGDWHPDVSNLTTDDVPFDSDAFDGFAELDVSIFLANIGGGGLVGGVATALASVAPEVRVVDDGTDRPVCPAGSVTDGTFVIDVSNGSVGGASCPALSVVDDVGNDTSIAYRDGANASGTYTMVIDEPDAAATDSLASPGSGEPYSTPAIYDATLRVTYRTADLDYEARIEAVPR